MIYPKPYSIYLRGTIDHRVSGCSFEGHIEDDHHQNQCKRQRNKYENSDTGMQGTPCVGALREIPQSVDCTASVPRPLRIMSSHVPEESDTNGSGNKTCVRLYLTITSCKANY